MSSSLTSLFKIAVPSPQIDFQICFPSKSYQTPTTPHGLFIYIFIVSTPAPHWKGGQESLSAFPFVIDWHMVDT